MLAMQLNNAIAIEKKGHKMELDPAVCHVAFLLRVLCSLCL